MRAEPVVGTDTGIEIVGESAAIRRAVALAQRFAPTTLPILLVGPTGSGKELFARSIHRWSGRPGRYVDVNAGALPREMVESLLFGHRRGAFTGALESSRGLLPAADGGTFFLDELASLPLEGQAKLLRALETGEVRPLGETESRQVRCRFVAAVQEDVDQRVRRGELRIDLYQRLAGVVIRLPALGERREDIPLLARAFARSAERVMTRDAEEVLLRQDWPGNVRELRACVLRSVFLADGGVIDASAIREAIAMNAPGEMRWQGVVQVDLDPAALLDLCRRHEWEVGAAAREMGIGRSTLYRRLRDVGIDPGAARKEIRAS